MLKEVEKNGQIALGEQFAGRRYELRLHGDGRVELLPVPATPASQSEPTVMWSQENADAIERYNDWAGQREPYGQRVRQWRAARSG